MQGSPLLPDDAPAGVVASVEQSAPLITGEALYLWTGAGAVIFVTVLFFVLLGRWRARRRAREAVRTNDFFQPAGEGAEITFDENDAAVERAASAYDGEFPFADPAPEPKKKKSGAFAGLFAKRGKSVREETRTEPELLDSSDSESDFAAVNIEQASPDWNAGTTPATDWAAIEREALRRAEEDAERAALERRRHDEESETESRWRAAEEERQLRLAEENRRRAERDATDRHTAASDSHRYGAPSPGHSTHDDIVRTLSEVEEALHVQREAIQAETRSLLDSFARRFSERLDALAQSVERRGDARTADVEGRGRGADRALLDEISLRLSEHKSEIAGALEALAMRVERAPAASSDTAALRSEVAALRQSLSGAAPPSAPAVQLADIVQNALAPGAYEFNALLANDRRADCLIRLSRPPGPIAIDAHFPVEAFHALHERRSAAAESEFRRIALRHIVNVADSLIAPGFTADSALLFLPSESMASELHARFPDVIQDSYRARVWIVSPTTLMATLHTMSALLRDAPRREQPGAAESVARRALSEVERLGERIAALEKSESQRPESHDLLSANDISEWRPAAVAPVPAGSFEITEADSAGDLFSEDDAGDGRRQTQARPPFPLR
jgi:DNA anti-recombination protein RmuC